MTVKRLIPCALLALAACNRQQPAREPAAPVAPTPVAAASAEPVNPPIQVIGYRCADGSALQAAYPDAETAVVTWKEHAYTLKIARSASGARYTGYGLQWWTKGIEEGAVAPLKDGETLASAKAMTCTAPSVEPPAPGTPGGLPDDRTPISEAPFTPTSAQGAANVAQTYFALLGEGKAAEAGKLRADGAAPDLSPYASYHAQVGGPGAIEGAAGSLYVEVPVVIYGRQKSGAELHQSGKAVLRRVNDVPGSTPEQRRWRIERIELKP
jgi:membrane-bound inhibitor of C-type lysozyme